MAWALRQNPDSVACHSGVLEYELKFQKKSHPYVKDSKRLIDQQDFLVVRVKLWQIYSQATLGPLAVLDTL